MDNRIFSLISFIQFGKDIDRAVFTSYSTLTIEPNRDTFDSYAECSKNFFVNYPNSLAPEAKLVNQIPCLFVYFQLVRRSQPHSIYVSMAAQQLNLELTKKVFKFQLGFRVLGLSLSLVLLLRNKLCQLGAQAIKARALSIIFLNVFMSG